MTLEVALAECPPCGYASALPFSTADSRRLQARIDAQLAPQWVEW